MKQCAPVAMAVGTQIPSIHDHFLPRLKKLQWREQSITVLVTEETQPELKSKNAEKLLCLRAATTSIFTGPLNFSQGPRAIPMVPEEHA